MSVNPFSARASFTVNNPTLPAANLLNAATSRANTQEQNFQSGINNVIRVANNATQSELNRQAQQQLQELRAQANLDLEMKREDFEMQKLAETNRLSQEADASDLGRILTLNTQIADNVANGTFTPEFALQYKRQAMLDAVRAKPQSVQHRNLAKSMLNLNERYGENADEVLDGLITGQLQDDTISDDESATKSQLDLIRTNAINEAMTTEAKLVGEQAKSREIESIRALPERVQMFSDSFAGDGEEENYFSVIKQAVEDDTSTAGGARSYVKARQEYNGGTRGNVNLVISLADDMKDVLSEIKQAGGSVNPIEKDVSQAITSRVLGGDSEGSSGLITKFFEEGFIKSRGRLSPERAEQLNQKMLSSVTRLTGPMTAINREVFKNVGTQTEPDFIRGFQTLVPPGASLDVMLNNVTESTAVFEGTLVKSDLYYGQVKDALNHKQRLSERGYGFDRFGTITRKGDRRVNPSDMIFQQQSSINPSINPSVNTFAEDEAAPPYASPDSGELLDVKMSIDNFVDNL